MKFETEDTWRCFIEMTTRCVLKCFLLKTLLWLFSLQVIRVQSGLVPSVSNKGLDSVADFLESSPDQVHDDYFLDSYEEYEGHFQNKQDDPLANLKRKLKMNKSVFRST